MDQETLPWKGKSGHFLGTRPEGGRAHCQAPGGRALDPEDQLKPEKATGSAPTTSVKDHKGWVCAAGSGGSLVILVPVGIDKL